MHVGIHLALLGTFILPTLANVEKTIFLAPEAFASLQHPSNLNDLRLERLTPSSPSVRLSLPASFPTSESPRGKEAWFVLDRLQPHQRCEVRICWAATVCRTSLLYLPYILLYSHLASL